MKLSYLFWREIFHRRFNFGLMLVSVALAVACSRWLSAFEFADEAKELVSAIARTHQRGSDRIVGATAVAAGAGELIGELSLAMTARIGLRRISSTIHPYPTRAEAIRKIGDQYYRARLTPALKRLLAWWLKVRR